LQLSDCRARKLPAKAMGMPELFSPRSRAIGRGAWLGGIFALLGGLSPVLATTKGLNQIVTPDIQPAGILSVSGQLQDSRIANPEEIQLELGLTPWAEVSFFQGLRPREEVLGTEIAILQKGPNLLTAGAINWSSRGGGAQPVLEYGYYAKDDHFIAGIIHVGQRDEGIYGYSHQIADNLQLSLDYQSGPGNSVTAGFTYNFTPNLQVNPALYFTNTRPHRALGYIVLTWNIPLWH
jgi:hypothetical protein